MTILEMFQSKDSSIQLLGSTLLLNETDKKIIDSCIKYYNDNFLKLGQLEQYYNKDIWQNMHKIEKKWKNIK